VTAATRYALVDVLDLAALQEALTKPVPGLNEVLGRVERAVILHTDRVGVDELVAWWQEQHDLHRRAEAAEAHLAAQRRCTCEAKPSDPDDVWCNPRCPQHGDHAVTVPPPRVETREDGTRMVVRSLHDLLPSDVRTYDVHQVVHPGALPDFLNSRRELEPVAVWAHGAGTPVWVLTVRRG
jgi:hypothetical protein